MVMVIPASAATVTIDFEDLVHDEIIGSHYPGLTFSSNARIMNHSLLSESQADIYTPHSGTNMFCDSSNIRINFTSPVSRVRIWYTSLNFSLFMPMMVTIILLAVTKVAIILDRIVI